MPMDTATTGLERTYPSHYITTCWAHKKTEAPQIQVDGRDATATLNPGEAQPNGHTGIRQRLCGLRIRGHQALSDGRRHADYPQGALVESLPGGPCWCAESSHSLPSIGSRVPRKGPGGPEPPRKAGGPDPQVWVATKAESADDKAPEPPGSAPGPDDPGLDAPICQVTPPPSPVTTDTPFSEYPTPDLIQGDKPSQFGRAQLEDPNLQHAWRTVSVVEGVVLGAAAWHRPLLQGTGWAAVSGVSPTGKGRWASSWSHGPTWPRYCTSATPTCWGRTWGWGRHSTESGPGSTGPGLKRRWRSIAATARSASCTAPAMSVAALSFPSPL